jgi:hypothetical protein
MCQLGDEGPGLGEVHRGFLQAGLGGKKNFGGQKKKKKKKKKKTPDFRKRI